MRVLLLLCCVVGAVVSMAVIDRSEMIEQEAWQMWKQDHLKSYLTTGEEEVRMIEG